MDSTVMADPTQIHQVLMNLCANAHHAMQAKVGVLSISLENVDLVAGTIKDLPDLESGPYLKLTVSDTGHGIDETIRQRIFDPYFTTKGLGEGSGLGLAVVYGIVKNLEGGIAVFSKPGEGTTFDVYLPSARLTPSPVADESNPLPTGKGAVLVVDDEVFIVNLLETILNDPN